MRALQLCIAIYASLAVSQKAADYNVSLEIAESYGCDEYCYEVLQTAEAADLAEVGEDFDWDFYTVAENFSTSKPGDLLKFKPIDPTNLTVPSGVSAYRIQYVSTDLDGSPVPVTGYIALPYSLPADGAFPLVAWAHGTIGLYSGCTVSNGPNFFDYNSWTLLPERGYAVVATDYAGLGLNYTTHKYCAFPAGAEDVYYSVLAARQAPFGNLLSEKWLSVGHSQGGGVVWKLAEDIEALSSSSASSNDTSSVSNYIGTVALAPATKVIDQAMLAAKSVLLQKDFHNYATTALIPFLGISISRVYPNYTSSELAEPMRTRIGLSNEAQLCASGLMGLTLDLDLTDLTTLTTTGLSAADAELASLFQNTTAPSMPGTKASGPVLVVQGVNDTAILAETTTQAWEDACSGDSGNQVKLMLYPKQDHSGVITAASPDWLRWVDDRFAGKAANVSCEKVLVQPFDYEYVKAEPEIDLSSGTLN